MAQLPQLSVKALTELINVGGVDYFKDHNLFLYGKHGIGKSEVMRQIFSNHPDFKNHDIHVLMLGQMSDVGDILGLPREIDGHMTFVPPYWWPTGEKARPIVLILDEMNRGRPEILQCAFDLTLNKTVAGRTLPEGSVVISAGNLGEEYQVNDLDPALNSRFDIYEFRPTVDEWLGYASSTGIDKRVISYITKYPGELEKPKEDLDDSVDRTPDRRAWVRVSKFLQKFVPDMQKMTDTHATILAGIIGLSSAGMFKKFCDTMSGVSPEMLYNTEEFATLVPELTIMTLQDHLYLIRQSSHWLKANKAEIEKSKGYTSMVIQNLLSYLGWCDEMELREAIATFTQDLQTNTGCAYLLKNKDLRDYISNYIMNIKM